MQATFDRKFGPRFVQELSAVPAVYLFKNAAGDVIYVGKAKDVRRRLGTYRNATRRKVHRKQRAIVRAASKLEVRPVATERDALILENELIRSLRPEYNVDGKYEFLYPFVGIATAGVDTMWCLTTQPDAFDSWEFDWYGCFRSRLRAKDAFEALMHLISYVGHTEKTRGLPRIRGSYARKFRRVDPSLVRSLHTFFAGTDMSGLQALTWALMAKPRARQEAGEVQARLEVLKAFHASDLRPLREAMIAAGLPGTHVAQSERDMLFLR